MTALPATRRLLAVAALTLSGAAIALEPGTEPLTLTVPQASVPFSVVRGGHPVPPSRNLELMPDDRLQTGPEGRGSFKFGSTVMTLGEQGTMDVSGFDQPEGGAGGRLQMKLLSGNVRIDGTAGSNLPEDVRITLSDLRVRIYGADVSLESTDARRSVCLLSGAVEIATVSSNQRLDQPGDCLVIDAAGVHKEQPDDATMRDRLALTEYGTHSRHPVAETAPIAPPPVATAAPVPAAPPRAEAAKAAKAAASAKSVKPAPGLKTAKAAPEAKSTAAAKAAKAAQVAQAEKSAKAGKAAKNAKTTSAARAGPKPAAVAKAPAPTPGGAWTLVAAALADSESAEAEAQGLLEQGLPAVIRIHDLPDGQRVFRVTVGSYKSRESANEDRDKYKNKYGMAQLWAAPY